MAPAAREAWSPGAAAASHLGEASLESPTAGASHSGFQSEETYTEAPTNEPASTLENGTAAPRQTEEHLPTRNHLSFAPQQAGRPDFTFPFTSVTRAKETKPRQQLLPHRGPGETATQLEAQVQLPAAPPNRDWPQCFSGNSPVDTGRTSFLDPGWPTSSLRHQ